MIDDSTYKDVYTVLLEISKVWDDINDIDQASLLEALAGKRQANIMSGLLSNGELLEQIYETAENSAGSAQKEQENYEKSIEYSLERMKASVEEWAHDLVSSDLIKWFIDLTNAIINVSDKFGSLATIGTGIGIFEIFKNFDTQTSQLWAKVI